MILDACFLIDLLAADEAAVAKLEEVVADGVPLSVSAITVTEVRRGLNEEAARNAFDDAMEDVAVVPFGGDEARLAASLHRRLDGDGRSIGAVDGMVAAAALERDGRIVTRNVSEFRRVADLRVVPY